MNKLLEKYLFEKYPKILVDIYGPMDKTSLHWGIETADGWFFLLNNLLSQIQNHIDSHNKSVKEGWIKDKKDIPQVIADQIKEKFGCLRIYYHGGDDTIRGMVQCAEAMSHDICENCGRMDHTIVQTKGWIQHLCVECANEYKKDYIVDKEMKKLWEKVIKSRKNPARSWGTLDSIASIDLLTNNPIIKKRKK